MEGDESNMKKIYVAGPYSQGDVMDNVLRAIEAGDTLYTRGYAPYVPHFTHFWHAIFPHPYEEWLRLDNEWLPLCDGVLRLPGASNGADKEVALAESLNIPVFYSINDVVAYWESC